MRELNYTFGNKKPEKIENSEDLHLADARFLDCETNPLIPYWINNTTCFGRVKNTFGFSLPRSSKIKNILEIGCSIGMTTLELNELYPGSNIIAADINSVNLARSNLKRFKNITFYHGDGYYPSTFCNINSQDAVFLMNNLAHVANKMNSFDLESVLHNISSVLKPGGYMLISSDDCYIISRKKEYSQEIIKCYKSGGIAYNNHSKIAKIEDLIKKL